MPRARSAAGFSARLTTTLSVVTIAGSVLLGLAGPTGATAETIGPFSAAGSATASATPAKHDVGNTANAAARKAAASDAVRRRGSGSRPVSAPAAAPVQACPAGFDFDDGTCVSKAATTCPTGHLRAGWCVVEPTYTCPGRGELHGATCLTPAERVCSPPASLTAGSCAADARLTCPDGGWPDSAERRCTSSARSGTTFTLTNPTPTAPDGPSGSPGPSSQPEPPPQLPSGPPPGPPPGPSSCPPGSVLADDGVCDWPTSYECPDGLALDGGDGGDGSPTCTGPPRTSCPTGATPGPDGCETAPTATCPSGSSYAAGDDGRSSCRYAPTADCDRGTLEGGRCVEAARCPPGASPTSDGRCLRQPVDPAMPCPRGTALTGGSCLPPPVSCPAGTITTPSGECVARVTCPNGTVENPNGTCRPTVVGCPPGGWVLTASGVCAPVASVCLAGTVRDERGLCLPRRPECPPDTLAALGGGCYPAPPDPVDPPLAPPRLPHDGELLLTPALADAGDSVTASGAGCDSAAAVSITSAGEEVGRATTDEHGLFTAELRFGTFAAGAREVTAHCGPQLSAQLDMVLASSTGADGRTHVLLVFFGVVGALVLRRQFAAALRPPR